MKYSYKIEKFILEERRKYVLINNIHIILGVVMNFFTPIVVFLNSAGIVTDFVNKAVVLFVSTVNISSSTLIQKLRINEKISILKKCGLEYQEIILCEDDNIRLHSLKKLTYELSSEFNVSFTLIDDEGNVSRSLSSSSLSSCSEDIENIELKRLRIMV